MMKRRGFFGMVAGWFGAGAAVGMTRAEEIDWTYTGPGGVDYDGFPLDSERSIISEPPDHLRPPAFCPDARRLIGEALDDACKKLILGDKEHWVWTAPDGTTSQQREEIVNRLMHELGFGVEGGSDWGDESA